MQLDFHYFIAGSISVNSTGSVQFDKLILNKTLNTKATGDITQISNGTLRVPDAVTLASSGGVIELLSAGNLFENGVSTTARVVTVRGDILGDQAKAAAAAAAAAVAIASSSAMPATNAAPLVAGGTKEAASAGAAASSGSGSGASASGTSLGLSVELLNRPDVASAGLVAVSLPQGTSVAGTGFSFSLPADVSAVAAESANVSVSLPTGEALPQWLRFDSKTAQFTADAVPDGSFPMQVVLQMGGQQVIVLISERQE